MKKYYEKVIFDNRGALITITRMDPIDDMDPTTGP